MVDKAVLNLIALMPFKFKIVGFFNWCVVIPKQHTFASEFELNVLSAMVLEYLPALSLPPNGMDGGFIYAIIKTNDLIQLRTTVKKWWLVKEVRPSNGTLLLKLYSEINRSPSLVDLKSQLKRSRCEYKEITLISLVGVLVWRAGMQPMTIDDLHRAHEDHLSYSKTSRSIESKQSLLFKFPQSPHHHLHDIIQAHHDRTCIHPNESMVQSIQALQQRAQLAAWSSAKESIVQARRLMQKINPYLVIHRNVRQLLVHALKSLSKGGFDLLGALQEWVQLAKINGEGTM